jgi:hypothetical protein
LALLHRLTPFQIPQEPWHEHQSQLLNLRRDPIDKQARFALVKRQPEDFVEAHCAAFCGLASAWKL